MTRLEGYLRHILEAIARIQAYTSDMDEADFLASRITQDAVIRNIEIIGEAGRNIRKHDPGFAAANPKLRLDAAYAMRNAVSHGYFDVKLAVVWATVQADLPDLHAEISGLMNGLA